MPASLIFARRIPRGVFLSGLSPGVHVYEAVGGRALGVVAEPAQRPRTGPIVLEPEFEIERNGVWGVPRPRNKFPSPPLQFERDTRQRMDHRNPKRHHGLYGRGTVSTDEARFVARGIGDAAT